MLDLHLISIGKPRKPHPPDDPWMLPTVPRAAHLDFESFDRGAEVYDRIGMFGMFSFHFCP